MNNDVSLYCESDQASGDTHSFSRSPLLVTTSAASEIQVNIKYSR